MAIPMAFAISKPQQELPPIMAQIGSSSRNTTWSFPTPSKRLRRSKKSSRCCTSLLMGSAIFLLMVLPYLLTVNNLNKTAKTTQAKDSNDSPKVLENPSEPAPLIQGSVGEENIPYYHQPAGSPSEENHHLILLHGAAFTKENWKTSGILNLFRSEFPSVTVTALDLPVSADHSALERLLRSMRDEDLIQQLPVSGIVTPSASGKSITTWIKEGASSGMESYLSLWIPVASYSVAGSRTSDLANLQQLKGVDILAIYGDKDGKGKTVMQTLHDHAGATLKELPGRHPVYLDCPETFVKIVGGAILGVV